MAMYSELSHLKWWFLQQIAKGHHPQNRWQVTEEFISGRQLGLAQHTATHPSGHRSNQVS